MLDEEDEDPLDFSAWRGLLEAGWNNAVKKQAATAVPPSSSDSTHASPPKSDSTRVPCSSPSSTSEEFVPWVIDVEGSPSPRPPPKKAPRIIAPKKATGTAPPPVVCKAAPMALRKLLMEMKEVPPRKSDPESQSSLATCNPPLGAQTISSSSSSSQGSPSPSQQASPRRSLDSCCEAEATPGPESSDPQVETTAGEQSLHCIRVSLSESSADFGGSDDGENS